MSHLKKICAQDEVMKIWVVTTRSNSAAVRLYESTGGAPQSADDTVIYEYPPASFATPNLVNV